MKRARNIWQVVQAFSDAVDAALKNNERRGKGGQQVSFHGDFASAPPSTLIQLRRWADELTSAADREPTP